MRVAVVTDWFAPRPGGIESQLLQLAQRLGARGHAVDVITSTPDARSGAGFAVRPLDVMTLPRIQLAASPFLIAALARELRRGYDVVHAHVSVVSPVGYAAAAVARAQSLPTVLTFHSVLLRKRLLLRAVDALARISESGVVWTAVSDLVARQAASALGVGEVTTLPNGIDLAAWRETSAGPKGPPVTIVSATRMHPKKRPLQLMAAFARAAAGSPVPARLIVAGAGPLRARVERAAARLRRPGAAIDVHGWESAAWLRALYSRSDGFAIASKRESFGIAALEARAAGLPVIAMTDSGSREFVESEDNGLLCGDDVELERQLARFLGDVSLRHRLAASSRSLDRYDWANVIRAHEAAYTRAMTGPGARATVAASA